MKKKLLRIVINGIFIGAMLQPFFLSVTLASNLGVQSEQVEGIIITGKVTSEDENEGGLPGVNVILKGTRTGSVTDVDGNYKIEVSGENAVLVYSSIGYATQEITVGNRSTIDVILASDIQALQEIIVVGYGSQEKKDVTGAIGSVSTEDFAAQPVTRIDQALQGRVAGVTVTNSSGAPGGAVSIRVRGANSITGNNDPLYVIDGFVGGDFNIINPADIESIQVLKDASATAVYGSRGSNGVVLITTKKGTIGKPKLSFTTRFSTSEVIKKWDLMDAGTFAEVANQRAAAFGSTPKFTDADIAFYKANGGTDWQDELFSRAFGQEYQLDYSGGTEAVNYFVSGNYYDQEGIVLNSGYERFALRTNVSAKLSDKLTADIRLNFIRRETNNVSGAGTISGALAGPLSWSPTTPVRDANGNLTLFDPISSIKENPVELALNDNIQQISTFLTYASLNYKIIDGLTFDVAVGFNYENNQQKTFAQNLQNSIPAASRISRESIFLQNTNNLTYAKNFGGVHSLTVTGVLEHQQRTVDSFGANAQNLTFPELKYDNLTLAESSVSFADRQKESIRSYIGRVSYEYNQRYLITASIRSDGSSKFRGSNQSSTFPSVALGWRLSEEDFLSGGFFDDLKLRGSWGKTGSQGIGVFGTVTTFATSIEEAGTSFTTGTTLPGIVIGNPGNSNLRWETTTQINGGFDMQVLNGRLALTMDYFVKNTTDLLLEEPLPRYVGGGNLANNVGEVQNKGIEISIGSTIIDKENFRWTSSFNASFLTNSVTDLGDREEIFFNSNVGAGLTGNNESIIRPGLPISSYWGVNYLGTWKTAEAAAAAVYGNVPGDSKYEDLNNDGIIDGEDFMVIGSGMPETIFGWNNTLEYKNFSFNVFFMAMGGYDKWNLGYAQAILPNPDSFEATSVDILDRWVAGSNEDSNISAFSPTSVDFFQSSRWVERGDFLRLKNVSLTYSLPKDLIKGVDAQFSIAGTNLWTLTNYKGLDPEAFSNNGEGDRAGGDASSYPNSKTWTFSINLIF
ncbi:MAG: TonB-dependent receptor [Cyclobacteriaceae bacterium]|nr:TonB-dependent receptor [Cyclobacteriaceae bacterium]